MLTDGMAVRGPDLNSGRTSGDVSGTDRENSNTIEGNLLRVRVPPSAPSPATRVRPAQTAAPTGHRRGGRCCGRGSLSVVGLGPELTLSVRRSGAGWHRLGGARHGLGTKACAARIYCVAAAPRSESERTIRWAIRRPIQTISTTAARPGAIHWPSARCMPASIAASAQTMAPSPMMRLRDMADPLASALTIADSPARVPPKVPVRCRPSTERARAPGAIPDRPSVTPSRGDPG